MPKSTNPFEIVKTLALAAWIGAGCAAVAQTPPVITAQPTNILAPVGSTASLNVGVSGTGPFTYNWFFNGAPAPINGNITTVAGSWPAMDDGNAATNAELYYPIGEASDASGNLYIVDQYKNCIRKVGTNGIITTVAGNGTNGYSGDGGAATNASLSAPGGVAVDTAGNLYIADWNNFRIRKVGTNGIITTVAGNGINGYSGDGAAATNAKLGVQTGVAVDAAGNLYIADTVNNRIRKLATNGIITLVAGNQSPGYGGDGGQATSAYLEVPSGVAVGAGGSFYIADTGNNRIRKVASSGIITTVAGNGTAGYSGDSGAATSAELNNPVAVALDAAGNLYIADLYNNRIRKVGTNGIISTVSGNGIAGYSGDGAAATNAEINDPEGVALDAMGNLYIADLYNNRIREVRTNGIITTVAGGGGNFPGDGGAATNASLYNPAGVAVDGAGNLYVADRINNRIRKVGTNGTITTVAGEGTLGYSGDGGAATSAELFSPGGVALDAAGNLYIVDSDNCVIRRVATNGIITTVAGNGIHGFGGDGGAATNAKLTFHKAWLWMLWAISISRIPPTTASAKWGPMVLSTPWPGMVIMAIPATGGRPLAQNYCSHKALLWMLRATSTSRMKKTNAFAKWGPTGSSPPSPEMGLMAIPATGLRPPTLSLKFRTTLHLMPRAISTSLIDTTNAFAKSERAVSSPPWPGTGLLATLAMGRRATNAELSSPASTALDTAGNLYIADTFNNRVRKVTASSFSLGSGGASLIVSSANATIAGNYYVVISNSYGSVTSSVASVSLTAGISPARCLPLAPSICPSAVRRGAITCSFPPPTSLCPSLGRRSPPTRLTALAT